MDQNQTPSFEIPKSPETQPVYAGGAETDPGLTVEGTREILPAPQSQTMVTPGTPPVQSTTPVVPQPQATPQQTTVPQNDQHLIAEEVDVMEREWVERAKKVVSLTSHDPYLEAIELNKLKTTYMKKRFGKDLPAMTGGNS